MVVAPVLPIRDVVVFPRMVMPLFIGRQKTIRAVQAAMNDNKRIILVTQCDGKTDDPQAKDLYEVGTVATVLQMLKLPDGTLKVLVEAHARVRLQSMDTSGEYIQSQAVKLESEDEAVPKSKPCVAASSSSSLLTPRTARRSATTW